MKNKFIILLLFSMLSLNSCGTETIEVSSDVSSTSIESENNDIYNETLDTYTSANTNNELNTTLEANKDNDVIEIREELFVTQCVNIYNNANDYENRTLSLEGMYDEYTDEETGITYSYVQRQTPGCCGDDGLAGFEFEYDGEKPNINDWIKVTGTVNVIRYDSGFKNIILDASDVEVMDTRGKEFVNF